MLRILLGKEEQENESMNVLVFGQGKSGTTVVSKTIQHSLPGASYLLEPKSEEKIASNERGHRVVKILHGQWQTNLPGLTRILRNESAARFDRIVKIIRDPRDQAISFLLYNFYGNAREGHASDEQLWEIIALFREKERRPATISFSAVCAKINRILGWNGFSSRWLLSESGLVANRPYWSYLNSFQDFGYLMKYETFMQGDLRELESYLGISLSPNREVGEFTRTRRSASWGNWREFFTLEDVELLRPLTGELLSEMGYPEWALRPVDQLNPEHFSGYLVKLMQEARSR